MALLNVGIKWTSTTAESRAACIAREKETGDDEGWGKTAPEEDGVSFLRFVVNARLRTFARNRTSDSALAVHLSCNIDCGSRGITIDPPPYPFCPEYFPVFILLSSPALTAFYSFTSAVILSVYALSFLSSPRVLCEEEKKISFAYNLFKEEFLQDRLRIR